MKLDSAQIGLLTWHYYKNVGSNLQAYAIQTAVESLGYSCAFINYRGENKDNALKSITRDCMSRISTVCPSLIPEIYHAESYKFQEDCFKMTSPIYGKENLKQVVPNFKMFLCGSDQIWAPNVLNDVYLFSFLDENTPRCSYAASIGLGEIPDDLDSTYTKYLRRFKSVSVREQQGCDLLKRKYAIQATCVLDPTFLLAKEEWLKLAKDTPVKENFIFCYFLGKNQEHREWVRKLSELSGYRVICLTDNREEKIPDWECHYRIGPEKFLSYISHSEFVVTDSFHGIALSINMEKPFFALERIAQNDKINQNARVYNILNLLNLQDQLLNASPKSIPFIDYSESTDKLIGERERSVGVLKSMIEECLLGDNYPAGE